MMRNNEQSAYDGVNLIILNKRVEYVEKTVERLDDEVGNLEKSVNEIRIDVNKILVNLSYFEKNQMKDFVVLKEI